MAFNSEIFPRIIQVLSGSFYDMAGNLLPVSQNSLSGSIFTATSSFNTFTQSISSSLATEIVNRTAADLLPNIIKTGSYTLSLGDNNTGIIASASSEVVITVPSSSAVNFTTGSIIPILQVGTATASLSGSTTGVTIIGPLSTGGQNTILTLWKTSIDTWYSIASSNTVGAISGSGNARSIAYYSSSTFLTSSLLYQSGSGAGAAILIGSILGSGSAILQINGNTYFSGAIFDSLYTTGSSGQILSSIAGGVKWVSAGGYDASNLNAATASLNNFSASILTYTSSINTQIANIFASESNYLPTSSFVNIGKISGSGLLNYLAFFNGLTSISQSLFYQTGSGTSSAMLLGAITGSGSVLLQIYGNTYHSGAIYDSTYNSGSSGQILSSIPGGVQWIAAGGYNASNLNSATASLQQFSASILTYTASTNTQILNVFASESNYLPTSSFVNIGTVSGSGVAGNLAVFSGITSISKSLFFQSGSGTSSAMLLGIGVSAGSGSALLQIYGSTYFSGALYDSTQNLGQAGQTLVAGANGVVWIGTASLTSLNTTSGSVNTQITNLNNFSSSLLSFSSSILAFTGSEITARTNVFASQSNYLPTASFINVGSISGSGVAGNLAVFSGITSVSKSLFFQSGSGTSSAMLLGIGVSAGSGSALLQVYGSTYFSGAVYDSTQTLGTSGQTLVAGANGIIWKVTESLAALNTFTGSALTNLNLFSASILTYTGSINTQITNLNNFSSSILTFTSSEVTARTNVFASQSNYIPTASFVNIGTVSGSGVAGNLAVFSGITSVSKSLFFQSGSGTSSAMLLGIGVSAGSGSALLQIYGATYFSGAIYDSTQNLGTAGQTLVAGANGAVWILTASLASLNTTSASVNTQITNLNNFSASIITYTASVNTQLTNIFASESNYLPTSSFVNIGKISGSGLVSYLAFFNGITSVSQSSLYYSGSGTGSAILLGATTGTGSVLFQNFGTTYLSGALYDSTFNKGTSNQVLVSTAAGIMWVNSGSGGAPAVNTGNISGSGLNSYIAFFSGSTGLSQSIIYQTGSGTSSAIIIGAITGSGSVIFQVYGNTYLSGALYDATYNSGSSGQVLSSTAGGTKWVAAGGYDASNLNAATASLQNFSASILTYTASVNTQITNLNNFSASIITFTGSISSSLANETTARILEDLLPNIVKTGSYTLTLDDLNTGVIASASSQVVITLPSSSTVNFTTGSIIAILQAGTATASVSGSGAGVIINGSLSTSGQNTIISLWKVAQDTWYSVSSNTTVGAISGSGNIGALPYYSGSTFLSSSLLFHSGSGTGSAILVNSIIGSGSSELQVYGTTYFSGAIQDSTQALGSAGQTLVAGANGIVWTLTASLASLNTFSSSVGTISGSGTTSWIPVLSGSTALSTSLMFQSGSGTGSAIVVGANAGTIPSSATTIFQVSGGLAAIRFIGGSKALTINSNTGTGGGATPNLTITGSDAAGIINVSSSTAPISNAVICNVTFSMAYPGNPYVCITPRNRNAANITASSIPFVIADTTHFCLSASAGVLAANTIYSWFYTVIG